VTFQGIGDEELADIWYALSGAEIRHPGCFTRLLQTCYDELLRRRGDSVATFLDTRFRRLRAVDASEDVRANRSAETDRTCDEPPASG
jgi:hypothetical protein